MIIDDDDDDDKGGTVGSAYDAMDDFNNEQNEARLKRSRRKSLAYMENQLIHSS